MGSIVHATCPLCEACCGLSFTVEDNRVTQVRGDADDPLSHGFFCTKGAALPALHDDPDRLRQPLRRTPNGWREMDWTAALDYAAEGLRAVQMAHGRDALAIYRGNPTAHNLGLLLFSPGLIRTLGSRNLYSPTSMDQLPHMLVALRMYGHQLLMPLPDLDRTQLMLIVGGNPATSNGSAMTASGVIGRLRGIQRRGGRILVIDPRRTSTARLADQHLFIRPGSDALLLAALLHVLFNEGLFRPGRLAPLVDGLDRVRRAIERFTPERVADATAIAPDAIVTLARELAAAESAIVYGRIGTSVQAHGVTCQWLIQLLNLVTGNLDRPGGIMFTSPAVDLLGRLRLSKPEGFGRWRSRVSGYPEFCGELPVAALAEEMTTSGPGQVRGFLSMAGNPVLSMPCGPQLEQALPKLDFMVSVDLYLNETSRFANVIIPPVSPLERDHFDLVFNFLAIRNVAKWSPPVLTPPPGALQDWEIASGLHRRLARGWRERLSAAFLGKLGPRGIIALALRLESLANHQIPWSARTLTRLESAVHGVDMGPLVPRLPGRLCTPNGRIDAAPEAFLDGLNQLRLDDESSDADGLDLRMIGRRSLRGKNSWLHNLPRLMNGPERCTLLVHPLDASRRGLVDGDRAHIRSAVGGLEVTIQVTDEVMPGVVSLPHGYGHIADGTRQQVACARPGVNANRLIDPANVEPIGATAVLNGIPVEVSRIMQASDRV